MGLSSLPSTATSMFHYPSSSSITPDDVAPPMPEFDLVWRLLSLFSLLYLSLYLVSLVSLFLSKKARSRREQAPRLIAFWHCPHSHPPSATTDGSTPVLTYDHYVRYIPYLTYLP